VDRSNPYGSWRWGGPSWTGQVGEGAPGRLAGITIAVDDPAAVASRWGEVLGVPVSGVEEQPLLELDGGEVSFRHAVDQRVEGLVEIAVEIPPELRGGRETVEVGGVRLRLLQPARP
jgi:hypothetical protein